MIRLVILGCVDRTRKYLDYIKTKSDFIKLTAIADPNLIRRKNIGSEFNVPSENIFTTSEELLSHDIDADAVLIANPDKFHFCSSMKSLDKGWNILLEKPIACTDKECEKIAHKAKAKKRTAGVCNVMSSFPY